LSRLTLPRCVPRSTKSSPRSLSSRSSRFRRTRAAGVQLSRGGGREPSPTRDRSVSGKKLGSRVSYSHQSHQGQNHGRTHNIKGTRTAEQKIVRNQKIDLQPRVPTNTPPRRGPTAHMYISTAPRAESLAWWTRTHWRVQRWMSC
jgi:hypothetical protein